MPQNNPQSQSTGTHPAAAEVAPPDAYQALTDTALRNEFIDRPVGELSEAIKWHGYVENDPYVMKELAKEGYKKILKQSQPALDWDQRKAAIEKLGLGESSAISTRRRIGSAALKTAISISTR